MLKTEFTTTVNLQMFADGASSAPNGGSNGDIGTGGSKTGVNSSVPDLKTKADEKNPLANVQYGIQNDSTETIEDGSSQDSVAPNETKTVEDKKTAFEALIKGEYKEQYNERVSETVTKRLKSAKDAEDKLNTLSPMFDLLSKKYGVKSTDIDGLIKAVEEDNSLYEEEAIERGLTVEQLREVKKLEHENAELKRKTEAQTAEENANKIYATWLEQAEQAKIKYPSLDLSQEIRNKDFAELLRCGVSVDTAYTVIHKDEIMAQGMQYAAMKTGEKLANSMLNNKARPAENGANSQASAVIKSDVSKLTKADRAEIARRVARGEIIKF